MQLSIALAMRVNQDIGMLKLHRLLVVFVAVVLVGRIGQGANVVKIAHSFPNGGGYKWKGTGVPDEIRFKGERILAKGESTYCSGFTFAVAMKAAEERGLLRDKSADDVRAFQKQWYGATKDSGETQCAYAVEQLGIGKAINPERAKPGDFMQLWRSNKSGHSVVFLEWVKQGRKPIGVKYRSSQPATDGIGDRVEYFAGVSGKEGKVDPKRIYIARLNAKQR
jgi:hypothetical protein